MDRVVGFGTCALKAVVPPSSPIRFQYYTGVFRSASDYMATGGPQLVTDIDLWNDSTNIDNWRSLRPSVKICHLLARSEEAAFYESATVAEIAAFFNQQINAAGPSDGWDGLTFDEISFGNPTNSARSLRILEAAIAFKSSNPTKLWMPYFTPGSGSAGNPFCPPTISGVTSAMRDACDFFIQEVYQHCSNHEADPSLNTIINGCTGYNNAGQTNKAIFVINGGWSATSCPRPSPSYAQAQFAKIKELCPNAAGVGIASNTGGTMNGIALSELEAPMRAIYG